MYQLAPDAPLVLWDGVYPSLRWVTSPGAATRTAATLHRTAREAALRAVVADVFARSMLPTVRRVPLPALPGTVAAVGGGSSASAESGESAEAGANGAVDAAAYACALNAGRAFMTGATALPAARPQTGTPGNIYAAVVTAPAVATDGAKQAKAQHKHMPVESFVSAHAAGSALGTYVAAREAAARDAAAAAGNSLSAASLGTAISARALVSSGAGGVVTPVPAGATAMTLAPAMVRQGLMPYSTMQPFLGASPRELRVLRTAPLSRVTPTFPAETALDAPLLRALGCRGFQIETPRCVDMKFETKSELELQMCQTFKSRCQVSLSQALF